MINAGATLGRVLFYDKRLSINDTISCSSCHEQSIGFSDPDVLSTGFAGGHTGRHSMGLANARFYAPGAFFWDERAATLEDQVLMPIQDGVAMAVLSHHHCAISRCAALICTMGGFPHWKKWSSFIIPAFRITPICPRVFAKALPAGPPRRMNMTAEEKAALVAFLKTLTDTGFLTDSRFSDPFNKR